MPLTLAGVLALAVLGGCAGRGEQATRAPDNRPEVTAPESAEPTAEETPGAGGAEPTPEPTPAPVPEPKPEPPAFTVVIDPGHQGRANNTPEPIGPGATETKPSVSSGTRGRTTGKEESQLNLEISLKLRDALQRRGVRVVMVRTTQDVDLSNQERAAVANKANAGLFVRIHADGNEDPARRGVSTLVPKQNRWTGPIVAPSARAGRLVQAGMVQATGAPDLGVVPRADLSGFNWSKVPTVLVEVGFLTNPAEDRLLSTPAYQSKLAEGMANGVVAFRDAR